ncbi:MAG: hypothetical protein AVO33_01160 [delta proteobacterium ML8_F1]|nr:MAG: hypothetical protein AVO33_01160 [delta proteobacterium ML8_F1]
MAPGDSVPAQDVPVDVCFYVVGKESAVVVTEALVLNPLATTRALFRIRGRILCFSVTKRRISNPFFAAEDSAAYQTESFLLGQTR